MTTQQITTPHARQLLRRSLFWIAIVVVALITIGFTLSVTRVLAEQNPLSASSPSPDGAQAIARVLADHGVTVTEANSLVEAKSAVTDAAATTIFFYDYSSILTEHQLPELAGLASNIVLVDPDFAALDALAPEVNQAGPVDGTLSADCDLTAVQKAGSVSGVGSGYRSSVGTTCLGSGDAVYSLIQLGEPGSLVTVLGTTEALDNEHVADFGNAALALNLLGATENLVWYLPTAADYAEGANVTLADLTPEWVTPIGILAILVAIAAALWKGRRLGALVVENLPVTVRASETMEGRARLYATASARTHALDSLRIGTLQRVGAMLGLPRVATVEEVVVATSEVLGIDARHVRLLLLDAQPRTDHELIQLSDDLLKIERDVARSLRPERMGE
jgi:CheY-like chemotaxis protein